MIDNHLHYTGSLPREFVFNKLRHCAADFLKTNNILTLYDFDKYIDGKFGDNYQKNRSAFDEIYKLFQSVTKPEFDQDIQKCYADGAYEIAKTAAKFGLSEYSIISGPYSDIGRTYDRYIGMILGFDRAESELGTGCGKIIITFIRGSDGKFKNFSDQLLEDIFKMIQMPEFHNRIAGFDISGLEYPDKLLLDENIDVLNKIIAKKQECGFDLSVGLHAGEIITGMMADQEYNSYFETLSNMDVQCIRHGTYLWTRLNDEKIQILKRFSGRCIFDICPTSNRLLTPFSNKLNYDILSELGVEFTLNRDDPSILNNWDGP